MTLSDYIDELQGRGELTFRLSRALEDTCSNDLCRIAGKNA